MLSEIELVRANRSKNRVIEILGGLEQPRNPKVQSVEITASKGKPRIVVLVTDAIAGKDPVLPREVEGIEVAIERCGKILRESHYHGNRQKALIEVKRIANDLAGKFGRKPSLAWPPSFKLDSRLTVVILMTPSADEEAYVVTVKALAGIGQQPPYEADMTISQMSQSQSTSDFIDRVYAGLKEITSDDIITG